MKKISMLSFLCLMVLTAEAAASVPNWWRGSPAEYEKLLKNANKEGKVVWYTTVGESDAPGIIEAFRKLYPGIEVEHSKVVGGVESRESIIREMQSGKTRIDVLEVNAALVQTYKKFKLLKSYDWERKFRVDPIQPDPEQETLKIAGNLHLIAYNTEKVSRGEAPKTWDDLLDPKWKGKKIGVDIRSKGLFGLYPVWGEKKFTEYLTRLAKQEPVYKRGTTLGVQMLGAGEFYVYAGATYDAIKRVKDKGAPIDFTVPPLIGVSFEREAVSAYAPHPSAAVLFLGWLASGGQKIYDEASGGEGLPLPGFDTMQGRLVKNKEQLSIIDDDTIGKRSEMDKFWLKVLGLKK